MEVTLASRSKWTGDLTILPTFAGDCRPASVAGLDLKDVKVGSEFGQSTLIREGQTQVLIISLGDRDKCETDIVRRAGGTIALWLDLREIRSAAVDTTAVESAKLTDGLPALAEGLALGAFRFDQLKSDRKTRPDTKVRLLAERVTKTAAAQIDRATTVSRAVNLARETAHQPPNIINPVTLAKQAEKLAAKTGLKCRILDEKQMKRLGMGGILGVGQGSQSPPRLIILEHAGSGKGKPVVLVGKAITFDTGGYSLKPRDSIVGMKYDKCGAMAVLGVMQAVAELGLKVRVIGIMAAAENMVSAEAYRPDDIITTLAGKTVEIVSADAEGRLVLCDALTYAQREYQPRAVIDLATLTGGVVVALGRHRAGIFCNDDTLRNNLVESGQRTHELLWPLPMDDEYLEGLKGVDSDLRNSGGREGHAILGAMFLKQFIEPKTRWAHLDIAGVGDIDKPMPYCPKGGTGFGVRLLVDYLSRLRG